MADEWAYVNGVAGAVAGGAGAGEQRGRERDRGHAGKTADDFLREANGCIGAARFFFAGGRVRLSLRVARTWTGVSVVTSTRLAGYDAAVPLAAGLPPEEGAFVSRDEVLLTL